MSADENMMGKVIELLLRACILIYWYLEALYRKFVPLPMKSIDGEIVLITGATGGIGKELCRYLVRSGSDIKLVIWDLNLKNLEKLAIELKWLNSTVQVFPYVVDISSREDIDECCKKVKEEVGPVSIIINNAGIAPTGNFLQVTNTEIEKTLQVNLLSHFWIIRQFLPEMANRNHGRIVGIASIGAFIAGPHASPYFTAKFGVNGMMEALKVELQILNYTGIHCTTVYPYFVKTPLITSLTLNEGKHNSLITGDFLEPSDVAKKTVDGMRREYELIYLPPSLPLLKFAQYLTPEKWYRILKQSYCTSFIHQDEKEQRKLSTLYNVPESNGLVKGEVNSKDR